MKFRVQIPILLALLWGGLAIDAIAQDAPTDPISKVIWDMSQMHASKTICYGENTSLSTVRTQVLDYLKVGVGDSLTTQRIASAMWALFPCPFSPVRPELRPAVAKDVEGAWIFPEESQKLRYGPRSAQPSPTSPLPTKCEAVGYFQGGERRNAVFSGTDCPYGKVTDLDEARKLPRVASWIFLRDGRLSVTRTDIDNHIEEWDVFVVQIPFEKYSVKFAVGDLIEYARRGKGNELGAATQFRHLKRLP